MNYYRFLNLSSHGDERGNLIAFEKNVNCPFDLKRCFYIFGTKDKNIARGGHANRNSEFLFVAVNGSCRVKIDTGKEKTDILLDSPNKALYLNKMIWKEMYEFSDKAVLLVLTNTLYDKNEYIRDYKQFLKEVRKC